MKAQYNVKIDNMLVVEGCLNDDKVLLGDQTMFMKHFCHFFVFPVCQEEFSEKQMKSFQKNLSDPKQLDKDIDTWMDRLDQMF